MAKMDYICTMRIFLCLFILGLSLTLLAQRSPVDIGNNSDTLRTPLSVNRSRAEGDSLKIYQPTINDYIFWTKAEKKQKFDTALSLRNQYRYTQFNDKENFGKIQFPNMGQTFNPLLFATRETPLRLLPYGKEQVFLKEEEIAYYDVKTPVTQFIFHNGYKEGQGLSTLFTHNFNSQFNYALTYKGIRSLGKYLNSEVDSRTFILSTNLHTKNHRYKLQAHYYNLNNGAVENGGIQTIENFTSGDSNYRNRQRLLTNLNGASSKYLNRRYYLDQQFAIHFSDDSLRSKSLNLGNEFMYETIKYRYKEKSSNTFFLEQTELIEDVGRESNTFNKNFKNVAYLSWETPEVLWIKAGVKWHNININSPNEAILAYTQNTREIKDNRVGFEGTFNYNWKKNIQLQSNAEFITGNYFGSTYDVFANLDITTGSLFQLQFSVHNASQPPAISQLYNTSFYEGFNYDFQDFENENISELQANLSIEKFATSVWVKAYNVENFTYFSPEVQPIQTEDALQLLHIGVHNTFDYKKFHIDTQLVFQNISKNAEILPLPTFVGRINAFYKDMWFKDAAVVQLGMKAYYFNDFKSRSFLPVNNEYILLSEENEVFIGNYPVIDLYLNMRVKSMQIYLEAQHFNSFFSGYNYFSAPNVPYLDFRLNIGLVWNLFT